MLIAVADRTNGEDSVDSIKQLARYHGTWMINGDRKRLLYAGPVGEQEFTTRSCVPGTWGQKILRLETLSYDARLAQYRAKIHYSNGKKWNAVGNWDPSAKTLTLVAPTKTGKRRFQLQFLHDRKHIFTIQEFDRDGKPGWSYREERFRLG